MSGMNQNSPVNIRKRVDIEDKNTLICFLQSCALLIFSVILLLVWIDYRNYYDYYYPDDVDRIITGLIFIILSCISLILLHFGKTHRYVIFISIISFMLGSVLVLIGYSGIICNYNCKSSFEAYLWAMPILLFLICILISIQISSNTLAVEKHRIRVQCLILALFCWLFLGYYYDYPQDYLPEEIKASEAGGTILWLAALATILAFSITPMNHNNRIIRIILAGSISLGAVLLFMCECSYTHRYLSKYDIRELILINRITPEMLAMLVSGVLVIDVLI